MHSTDNSMEIEQALLLAVRPGQGPDTNNAASAVTDHVAKMMYRSFRGFGLSPQDFEDAMQDAWITLLSERMSTRREGENVHRYLKRRSMAVCGDFRIRQRLCGLEYAETGNIDEPGRNETAWQSDLAETIALEMERLPSDQREVLIRHHYLGMKVQDIAEAMGVKPGCISSKLLRAHARFRECLQDFAPRYVRVA